MDEKIKDTIDHPPCKRDKFAMAGKLRNARTIASGQGTVGHTDEGVEVSVPQCEAEFWIDPSGNKVSLVVGTNRAKTELGYAEYIRAQKRRSGWRSWSSFDGDADREAHIQERKKRHAINSAKYDAIWRSMDEQEILRTQKGMAKGLAEFMDKVKEQGLGVPQPMRPRKDV